MSRNRNLRLAEFAVSAVESAFLRDPVTVLARGDATTPSLWQRLEGRDNALNALRLGLAVAVAVSHALIFGGLGVNTFTEQLGGLAVGGFFCISGFLIAGSRERLTFLPFMWRRILRLMPAYWVVLGLTAVVIAPLSTSLKGVGYDWHAASDYVARNAILMQVQTGIGDTLASAPAPYAGIWNGSLWTLPYEFGAYLVAGIALTWLAMRTVQAAVATCSLLAGVVIAQWYLGLWPALDPSIGRLASFFAAGILMHALRHQLPASPLIASSSAAVVLAAAAHGYAFVTLVTPLPLAYLVLWLGARLPLRVGRTHDISYGMYIYAFPIQQLLVAMGALAVMPMFAFVLASVGIVLPLAWASWLCVERPALRLRRLVPTDQPARTVVNLEPVAPAQ